MGKVISNIILERINITGLSPKLDNLLFVRLEFAGIVDLQK
jgi:hypothetical protein